MRFFFTSKLLFKIEEGGKKKFYYLQHEKIVNHSEKLNAQK